MSNLTELRNIGPSMASMLERAGITSAADLKREGSRAVFKRLKEQGEPGM
ncbi:TfoX/Sxy family protein [Desulfovibrio sp. OttesenSCG-928-C06]|nr:TfoX/Sxy family protein [Desulfovibrio sp. OttesenSCG-928-C06]